MKNLYKGMLATFLFATVLFAGCVGQSKPAGKEPAVIIRATFGEPESLDPAFDYETGGWEIMWNVYERLVWYESERTDVVIPWLAESYTVSPDGLTYTFVLRKGIKFHDGTDFNADAVVYSLNRVMKMGLDPSWMFTDFVEPDGVKKVDDYTVTITLKAPYTAFITVLAGATGSIVSPTAVEAHGGVAEGQQNEWMNRNMVGTGPFTFESWEAKQQMTLLKNENYWGSPKGTGLAKCDKVIIREMDDENTRILSLKAGEVDFAAVNQDRLSTVIGEPGIQFDKIGPGSGITYMAFQYALPYFQDVNVRAAVAHSVDYDTMISQVVKGWGVRAQGPIPIGWFGHNPDLHYVPYDLDKAKEFLAKSNYPNGFKTEVAYNSGNNTRKQYALHVKDQLTKLGIDIEVKEYDWPTYLKKLRAKEIPLWIVGWTMDYPDPDNFVTPFLYSKGYLAAQQGLNDPEMDALVLAAQKELNPEKRKEMYFELQQITMDNYYQVWLLSPIRYQVHRDNITGIEGLTYNDAFGGGLWYYTLSKTPTP